ncbi:transposase [Bacteroides heparinolyticus]|uniref:transposase n=1 Tax=Prevotella heparinolytica TaxID=28113 RepID=UPI0035A06D3C
MSLLPNDFDMALETIVEIYRKRWLIESLFTQIKQNFPLRYFYGESANAMKIRVCATLIGNLLMTLLQRRLTRPWSFSGLATMVRIILMYYINMDTSFERPDEDLKLLLKQTSEEPLEEENLT